MTWEDLPDGLVDRFRKDAFALRGEGTVLVRLSGGTFTVVTHPGGFLGKVMERLHDLITRHVKADVIVMTGRMTKDGERLPPDVQIREFGV